MVPSWGCHASCAASLCPESRHLGPGRGHPAFCVPVCAPERLQVYRPRRQVPCTGEGRERHRAGHWYFSGTPSPRAASRRLLPLDVTQLSGCMISPTAPLVSSLFGQRTPFRWPSDEHKNDVSCYVSGTASRPAWPPPAARSKRFL